MSRTTKANKSKSISKFKMQHDIHCMVELTKAHEAWGDDVVQIFFKNDDDNSQKMTFFEFEEFKEFAIMVHQFIAHFKDVAPNDFEHLQAPLE